MKEAIEKLVRHALGLAGAWVAAKGVEVDPTSIDVIAGGLAALVSVVWSLIKLKKKA